MNSQKYLLKQSQIEAMPGKAITHFLNPNAQRINKSLGDAVGMQHLGIHLIYVEPGKETTEYHKHYYEEEAVYVLSGTATAIIDGEKFAMAAGDFLGLPRNKVAHTIINDGTQTLVCLVVGQRLSQDIGEYPNQNKRLYRNNGINDLVDISNIENITLSKK